MLARATSRTLYVHSMGLGPAEKDWKWLTIHPTHIGTLSDESDREMDRTARNGRRGIRGATEPQALNIKNRVQSCCVTSLQGIKDQIQRFGWSEFSVRFRGHFKVRSWFGFLRSLNKYIEGGSLFLFFHSRPPPSQLKGGWLVPRCVAC